MSVVSVTNMRYEIKCISSSFHEQNQFFSVSHIDWMATCETERHMLLEANKVPKIPASK